MPGNTDNRSRRRPRGLWLSLAAIAGAGVAGVWAVSISGAESSDRGADALAGRAVEFPAGMSYQDALQAIYTTAKADAPLPGGVKIVAALPGGKVLRPAVDGRGIVVSGDAPFGRDPVSGAVAPPFWRNQGEPLTEKELKALAASGKSPTPEWKLAEPVVFRCQVDAPGMPSQCPTDPKALIEQGTWKVN